MNKKLEEFSPDILNIDCERETKRIVNSLRDSLSQNLKRRGYVIAVSGGIDSSVTLALCVQAVGDDRVIALLMPEKDSSEDTMYLSQLVADHFKVEKIIEDITVILEALGFYKRYADAVKVMIPEYNEKWKSKLVIPPITETKTYSLFSIVAQSPDGTTMSKRLNLKSYLGIVAATSFKQRTRKMMEYYHADRLNYAVAGTPNRLEYDQGFFVKNGDGSADIKPIAHLYKTQVYQLAQYLSIPDDIINRIPTTDTYSLPQSQDEFYFTLPYDKMDLCLYAKNNNIDPSMVSPVVNLSVEQVKAVFKDIDHKRSVTKYLHLPPLLVEEI